MSTDPYRCCTYSVGPNPRCRTPRDGGTYCLVEGLRLVEPTVAAVDIPRCTGWSVACGPRFPLVPLSATSEVLP